MSESASHIKEINKGYLWSYVLYLMLGVINFGTLSLTSAGFFIPRYKTTANTKIDSLNVLWRYVFNYTGAIFGNLLSGMLVGVCQSLD